MASTPPSSRTVTAAHTPPSNTAAEIAALKRQIATLEHMTADARFRAWSLRHILILAGYDPTDRMLDGCDCPLGIERAVTRLRVHEDTVRIGVRSIQLADERWKGLQVREEDRVRREVDAWEMGVENGSRG